MNPSKKQSFEKAIILIKVLNNGSVVVVDSDSSIKLLNKDTLETIKSFDIEIKHQSHKNSVVALSSDGKYFASLSPDRRESILYETKTKNDS